MLPRTAPHNVAVSKLFVEGIACNTCVGVASYGDDIQMRYGHSSVDSGSHIVDKAEKLYMPCHGERFQWRPGSLMTALVGVRLQCTKASTHC